MTIEDQIKLNEQLDREIKIVYQNLIRKLNDQIIIKDAEIADLKDQLQLNKTRYEHTIQTIINNFNGES